MAQSLDWAILNLRLYNLESTRNDIYRVVTGTEYLTLTAYALINNLMFSRYLSIMGTNFGYFGFFVGDNIYLMFNTIQRIVFQFSPRKVW